MAVVIVAVVCCLWTVSSNNQLLARFSNDIISISGFRPIYTAISLTNVILMYVIHWQDHKGRFTIVNDGHEQCRVRQNDNRKENRLV